MNIIYEELNDKSFWRLGPCHIAVTVAKEFYLNDRTFRIFSVQFGPDVFH
jgi:hypothetical protein